MPETIESFVEKLQQDGVEAGRKEAEKIKADAQSQADKIVADAKRQAEEIVVKANEEAENVKSRSKTELRLAARDMLLKLQERLGKAMSAVLAKASGEALHKPEFIENALKEIIGVYAQGDRKLSGTVEVHVPDSLKDDLAERAAAELGRQVKEAGADGVDVKGTLNQAGFEYRVEGATVEVTLESVVEMLSEMVSPSVRELVEQATAEQQDKT